ncbi:Ppx/GppA phosphatase family protein [Jiulongibacter sp. NS-SX5]|uniref:Ppx/GppA phosphatase family protein n=1 Tax=Jiulongibacter sp. NS-SX5 TaxID=3463854 RepID=UPI0040588DF7
MRAIIDLGTNTFHLLVVDKDNQVHFKTSKAAKLGMGGIQQGIITKEGIARGVAVLKEFREEINKYQIRAEQIFAFGTSALRSASNQKEVLDTFKNEVDITVQVISGDREAELIYEGIKQAVEITKNSVIVDIGGGSVEFIICNASGILWKQSFEIGGQRLMELFFQTDPIAPHAISKMDDYFREKLLPLANACHQYQPEVLIGSSGSFDTLNTIYIKDQGAEEAAEQVGFDYPMEAFIKAYEQFITMNREERMAIPGMIELRVEMIVVASCLIRYLIQTFNLSEIKISKYAMKEGILQITS